MNPGEIDVEQLKTLRDEKSDIAILDVRESWEWDMYHFPEAKRNVGVTAICGKIEAELAEMSDADAAEFLSGYGLKESGLIRLINKTYELMGLISFLTIGEDECRAWTIPRSSKAVEAAGSIHSDLAKQFIRAETIHWDELLELGSEAAARAKGKLRLEGKDYIVQDGDVLHIRHGG